MQLTLLDTTRNWNNLGDLSFQCPINLKAMIGAWLVSGLLILLFVKGPNLLLKQKSKLDQENRPTEIKEDTNPPETFSTFIIHYRRLCCSKMLPSLGYNPNNLDLWWPESVLNLATLYKTRFVSVNKIKPAGLVEIENGEDSASSTAGSCAPSTSSHFLRPGTQASVSAFNGLSTKIVPLVDNDSPNTEDRNNRPAESKGLQPASSQNSTSVPDQTSHRIYDAELLGEYFIYHDTLSPRRCSPRNPNSLVAWVSGFSIIGSRNAAWAALLNDVEDIGAEEDAPLKSYYPTGIVWLQKSDYDLSFTKSPLELRSQVALLGDIVAANNALHILKKETEDAMRKGESFNQIIIVTSSRLLISAITNENTGSGEFLSIATELSKLDELEKIFERKSITVVFHLVAAGENVLARFYARQKFSEYQETQLLVSGGPAYTGPVTT